jgi:hypothetical protein
MENVVGDMAAQTKAASSATTTVSPKTDAKFDIVPMDNPAVVSGGIPVMQNFSGMSKSIGVEVTNSFDLHPARLSRQHNELFDTTEMQISHLCALKNRVPQGGFIWDMANAPETELIRLPLNSFLDDFSVPRPVGTPAMVLNSFMFWRADIEFELMVFRTNYQSGRLRVTVAYGAPELQESDHNVYYNQILDYKKDIYTQKWVVPWNQQTEFLRTFENASVDPMQDYSLGIMAVSVANQLRTSPVVVDSVNCALFYKFINVKVAVPRPMVFFTIGQPNFLFQSGSSAIRSLTQRRLLPIDEVPEAHKEWIEGLYLDALDLETRELHAQAGDDLSGLADPGQEEIAEQSSSPVIPVTADESPNVVHKPCRIQLGEKFEHIPTSVMEIARRHVFGDVVTGGGQSFTAGAPFNATEAWDIPVEPLTIWKAFYAAWGGSIRYRIFQTVDTESLTAMWMPFANKAYVSWGRILDSHLVRPGAEVQMGVIDYSLSDSSTVTNTKGIEQAYPISNKVDYIDVAVPFDTHFNFMQTEMLSGGGVLEPTVTGTQTGNLNVCAQTQERADLNFYQALGDDFAFGIFRPPLSAQTSKPVSWAGLSGDFQLGGFWMDAP